MSSSSASRPPSVRLQLEALEERCVPSTTTYVNALYHDLLHRAAAPAEVAGWVSTINAGVSANQVALAFTQSGEYLTNLIRADYKFFLERDPSAAEVAGWLTQLQAGLGEQQLQAAFLGSGEFFSLHGSANASWLDGVYKKVLGRPVDASGLSFWTQALQQGAPRDQVSFAILMSPEALTRLVTSAYQALLGRAPDPVGLASWVSQLQHGLTPSQLLAAIASSDEFIADQGGLDVVNPIVPVDVEPIDTFFDPFVTPFGVGFVGCGCTSAGFTGGFTGGGFTGGGFTGGFTGGGTGAGTG
jgi:hypothetical protein